MRFAKYALIVGGEWYAAGNYEQMADLIAELASDDNYYGYDMDIIAIG